MLLEIRRISSGNNSPIKRIFSNKKIADKMKELKTLKAFEKQQKEEEMAKEKAIEIRNLKKVFKTKHKEAGFKGSLKSIFKPQYKEISAINDISVDVKKGELVAFIGPNGAGKSTTIKILTGILHPDSGEVKVSGMTPWENRLKLAYKIGSVFGQKPQLWYHLPAIDTFNLFSKIYDLDEEKYKERLDYLVGIFEIKDLLNTPVRKLSLGQRMKCEIVAALLHRPEVLFLDEPTIGLDIVAKQKIRELIKELNEKEKVTILLTSHDTQDIEHLCKRIVIINHGKIVYDGHVDKLSVDYMKNKIISVKFDEPFKGFNMKGIKIIKSGEFFADIEVDTSKSSIKEVIDVLIKKYEIADINISSTPIEEVITKIYNQK
jgi:ABC-2 type transport system ATP-binding protein